VAAEQNDNRFVENVEISFVIYCDENGLTANERYALLDDLYAHCELSIPDDDDGR